MKEFENSLMRIDLLCEQNSIEYAVIGGLAVITHGSFRTTKDIDLTVLCNLDEMQFIHKVFSKEFIPIYDHSLEFFKSNFVIPSKDRITGIRVDIASGLTEFDKNVIKRRKREKLGQAEFYVCSIEDLIIYKLFAARYQDLADVKELISIHRGSIDKKYLADRVFEFYELEREDMKANLDKLLI